MFLRAFCPLCTAAGGQVHEVKQYGLLCDLAAHADVVGLAAPHQVGLLLLHSGRAAPAAAGCKTAAAVQITAATVGSRSGVKGKGALVGSLSKHPPQSYPP
jgi:hypothetical protein